MTWYRSLYWRIAVGFIACVAILLIVQGFLFVWMMARVSVPVFGQAPPPQAPHIGEGGLPQFGAAIPVAIPEASTTRSMGTVECNQYVVAIPSAQRSSGRWKS